jgi:long-chain acyl-CoA synthetase
MTAVPKRLFDYVERQYKTNPFDKSLSYKYDGIHWTHYSSEAFYQHVMTYSLAFLANGIKKGDTIAIISNNRPEWNFCDNGMMQIGAINVPIYPTSSSSDFEFIMNNAEIKLVFVSDKTLFDKVQSVRQNIPSIMEIYSFEQIEGCKHVSEFLDKADPSMIEKVKEISETIQTEDLATIIYTSGTTGNPKGVMLSHQNIVFNIEEVTPDLPVKMGERVLSFLPLCHIFERVVTYYYFSVGVEVFYAESIEKLKDNITEVRPNFFSCVPRLLEKIYEGLIAKGQEFSGFKKSLYYWAVRVAKNYDGRRTLKVRIADHLIFSKWRDALGGNILGIVTGAAALQPRLCVFFEAIGIPIREGYGLTETAPVISFNRFYKGGEKYGTVGLPLKNINVKLEHREGMAENEGEILVKGDNVMMGYYKNPTATAEAIKDGWLYTGDIGTFDEGKFLKITDRAKELFKTSGGKYVAPQVIENKMKESRYIEQIMVVGNDRRFISALVFPSIPQVKLWAEKNHVILDLNSSSWTQNEALNKFIFSEIDRYNKNFGQVEQIKKITLIPSEWTIESGELTPTMKPKRKVIESKYAEWIESMYV